MWFVVLAFGAILGLAAIWSIKQKRSFPQNIPVVEPWYPLIGNGLLFLGKNDKEKFWNLIKIVAGKDGLFRLYLGSKVFFGTGDPDMAQKIMTNPNCIDKPYMYDYFHLEKGVLFAKTHIWKGQRKALNPAFNMKILEGFVPIFCDATKNMLQRLDTIPAEETINITDFLLRCTLEMVCASTFDFNVSDSPMIDDALHHMKRCMYYAAKRMLKFQYHLDFIYRWTKDYLEQTRARKCLNAYGMQIYNNANERYTKGLLTIDQTEHDTNEGFRKPQLFVNQIFTNTLRKFDQEEIIDNIFTIVGAGTDTSATEVSYTLLQLAMYPGYQQKVYEEIMEIYPEAEPHITPESLKRLQYTEMVMNECLRLYPVAPHLLRVNTEDITLCGARIPKGSMFGISIYTIQRRKNIWGPDADRFDPERFSPERSAGRHPFAFLAFSGGSRNCVGARYAMISMKIMLVYLLKRYRFKTKIREEDMRFRFEAILRLDGGHLVQIEKRQ
ncbi:cytochrome P450 4c21-like [Aedes albopictus]|uniref:Cytochrome P450 n=1 Tax=Aedes albopictus TaxID=7160 RepID=A0ABM1Z4C2_AEDAL